MQSVKQNGQRPSAPPPCPTRASSLIPDTTPHHRLRYLRKQYLDSASPATSAMPAWYREALVSRIDALLQRGRELA